MPLSNQWQQEYLLITLLVSIEADSKKKRFFTALVDAGFQRLHVQRLHVLKET